MKFLRYQSIKFLVLLIFFNLILIFAINYLYIYDFNIFYNSYKDQLDFLRINELFLNSNNSKIITYILSILIILIRILFTTSCLFTIFIFTNINLGFCKLFYFSVIADFVFVVSGFSKLIILIFFKEVNTLDDLQFQPLSLLGLFDKSTIDPLFIYPLSLINVFELIYWLVLAYLLSDVIKKSFGKSLKLVASSYGVGLLLWVLVVMFFTVNLTP